MQTGDLQSAFQGLKDALASGDLDAFYGSMLPDAIIMDEDIPFAVDRAGFRDHIDFHTGGVWASFSWQPHDVRFSQNGDVGAVAGFAMFKGKPVDSGFRLRPMLFTQSWMKVDGTWRLSSWHQSPVVGHVSEQSPG